MTILRRKALITGAAGGMGRACARLFGSTHDLVLTDAVAEPLERFSDDLRAEGFTVLATHSGDLGSAALLSTLVADATGEVPLTLIHTAGLSPSQADASAIMAVNLVATVKLLDAIEPILKSGSVAVVIASTAGHMMPVIPEIAPLFADPLAPGFLDNVCGAIEAMSEGAPAGAPGFSYALSKQAVIALVEKRAAAWGQHGARIVSISPGLILTPMGRKELAETQGAAQTADAAPVGRPGIAMDIALAARFLASDEASFVSGCDLRVDGGSTAVLKTLMGG
uniref:SDR family oxidoreductase n=1 Tax=uncultured Sphingomonas sp. TaxID=158754 RepID=UPI0035CC76E0